MNSLGVCLTLCSDWLQELSDQAGAEFDNADVRWVITVPAIWKMPAKQFMREAAYKVQTHVHTCVKCLFRILLGFLYTDRLRDPHVNTRLHFSHTPAHGSSISCFFFIADVSTNSVSVSAGLVACFSFISHDADNRVSITIPHILLGVRRRLTGVEVYLPHMTSSFCRTHTFIETSRLYLSLFLPAACFISHIEQHSICRSLLVERFGTAALL